MKALIPHLTEGDPLPPEMGRPSVASELPAGTANALSELAAEASSPNTTRSYRAALRYWAAWHLARFSKALALPVAEAAVLQFIVDHASRTGADGEITLELPPAIDQALVAAGIKAKTGASAISTLTHRLTVLSRAHVLAQAPNPCQAATVRQALAQAKRAYAKRGQVARKKPAITRAPLEAMLATCDDSLRGKRDRAVLLFAWASGGRRRSEVAGAVHERLQREGSGFIYDLGASKTNQAAESRPEDQKPLAGLAATALQAWIEASGMSAGPIFRRIDAVGRIGAGLSASGVREIVKARCAAAGLDERFSAHSMRSGFVTEAGRQGVALAETMALSGHRSIATVSGYHRAGAALNSPAARLLEGVRSEIDQGGEAK